MSFSKIEWTECTWNPLTGCSKISSGCLHCYAERMAKRLQSMGSKNYVNGFKVTLHNELIAEPIKWTKPRMIFVNSMSDLFHEDVPFEFIQSIFKVMNIAKQHTFQVLTKRADRLLEFSHLLPWAKNIWMGVTVESGEYVERIEKLKLTNAHVKFVSFEPLLSEICNIDISGINWVIVGGESGPGARTMDESWVDMLFNLSVANKIPFFFKQWGGVNKKKRGRLFKGRIWAEKPPL